jgi:hypothetical protein
LVWVTAYGAPEREVSTAQRFAAVDTLSADANGDHEESEKIGELHYEKFACQMNML